MDLALAIPVHNDAAGLNRLLQQARDFGIFRQVIVVDDASQPPVATPPDPQPFDLEVLRLPQSKGAGAARNRAIAALRCSHVLFFDSDDLLTSDLPGLWQDLQRHNADKDPFDFCLFRHHDSRRGDMGGWGQMRFDDRIWRKARLSGQNLCALDEQQSHLLSQTANYPWNKIYSRDFLQRENLRFTEIEVHNDIEFHWASFITADRILASNRIAAVHFIGQADRAKQQITGRKDLARLQLFKALSALEPRLTTLAQSAGQQAADLWRLSLLSFVSDLMLWVRETLDPQHFQNLQTAQHRYFDSVLSDELLELFHQRDPVMALQILLQMAESDEIDRPDQASSTPTNPVATTPQPSLSGVSV